MPLDGLIARARIGPHPRRTAFLKFFSDRLQREEFHRDKLRKLSIIELKRLVEGLLVINQKHTS